MASVESTTLQRKHLNVEALLWIGFLALVVTLMALDLGLHRRKDTVLSFKEAMAWTGFYISLALAFCVFVYFAYEHNLLEAGAEFREDLTGPEAALKFFTAWLLEWSLSLDNIFVIALIFSYFKVPAGQQHRVLFWGILGALVFRALMILAGIALLSRFEWIVYVFGALLILTAGRMLAARHDNIQPRRNLFVRFCTRCFPLTEGFRGSAFFVREHGKLHATPLALALLVVETSDLFFALDSIPAAFAVTRDPFLVLTSNMFAVLGLRALYFALAGLMARFRYLKMSLVFILAFVGVKLLLTHHHPIPTTVSLGVIAGFLLVGVLTSVFHEDTAPLLSPLEEEMEELAVVTLRQARKVVILVVGSTLLLLGLLMIVTPGPGFLTVFLGLALLGIEFAWARVWLAKVKERIREVRVDVEKALWRDS
jgi:tellurite resistance protein TerC